MKDPKEKLREYLEQIIHRFLNTKSLFCELKRINSWSCPSQKLIRGKYVVIHHLGPAGVFERNVAFRYPTTFRKWHILRKNDWMTVISRISWSNCSINIRSGDQATNDFIRGGSDLPRNYIDGFPDNLIMGKITQKGGFPARESINN